MFVFFVSTKSSTWSTFCHFKSTIFKIDYPKKIMTTEVSLYFLTTLTFLGPRNQKTWSKTNLESLDSAGLLWLCFQYQVCI
jgi:hypothetical protein